MSAIIYQQDTDPVLMGVYACRISDPDATHLLKDIFLFWWPEEKPGISGWSYLGSDQRFRGEVLGWIGPLQRRLG